MSVEFICCQAEFVGTKVVNCLPFTSSWSSPHWRMADEKVEQANGRLKIVAHVLTGGKRTQSSQ